MCALGISGPSARAGQIRSPGSGTPLPVIEPAQEGRLDRLERWLKAVARHAPGEDAEALAEIAAWPNTSLKQLWVDANVLSQMVGNAKATGFAVRAEGQKTSTQIRYTQTDLHRLHALACVAGGVL